MKLIYPDWKRQIEFKDDKVQVINIENADYFSEIIHELVSRQDGKGGRFVLSEEDTIFDIEKNVEVLLSPFLLDFDNRKIQSTVIKKLVQIAMGEELVSTKELTGHVLEYMYKLSDYLEYDMSIDENVDMQQLFKIVGIKAYREDGNLIERLTDYICLLRDVLNTKLVVLINFKDYFNKDELESFYRTMITKKINILLLEKCSENEKIKLEECLTIDADLCEI